MEHRLGLGIVIVLALAVSACSKENEVDASTHVEGAIGLQCSGKDDPACGTAGVCTLGYCRMGCLTDAECPQGALCIGDAPPFGCQLPQDVGCNDADQKCQAGLVCGIDGNCRMPCSSTTKCPRNEQECIRGTCVAKSEAGALSNWFSCTTGDVRCAGADGLALEQCNGTKPGWGVAPEGTPGSCKPLGQSCLGPDEVCTGAGVACVLAYCRTLCGTDGECPQGTLCIGDSQSFGCQLQQDIHCDTSQQCELPLACGLDDTCRIPCGSSTPCPRNDQICIEGSCYGKLETNADQWLCGGATQGTYRCEDAKLEVCDVGGLGWVGVAECVSPLLCASAIARGEGTCPPTPSVIAMGQLTPLGGIAVDSLSVFWISQGTEPNAGRVMKAGLDGGDAMTLAEGQDAPVDLAIDATDVYWITATSVMKVGMDGGTPVTLVSGEPPALNDILVDGSRVYWSEPGAGTIMSVGVNGGTPTALATGQSFPAFLAKSATSLFWTVQDPVIMAASLGGGTPTILVSGLKADSDLASYGPSLYFSDALAGSIVKVAIAGGACTTLVTGVKANHVAVDASGVYWTDPIAKTVNRVGLDGGTPIVLASDPGRPGYITTDATAVYWTSLDVGSVMKVEKQ